MSRKKRRHYNGPPKGAIVNYKNSPQSSFAHQWFPPKGSAAYFHMESDFEFQRRHPVGYVFAVLLGIFALLLPEIVYLLLLLPPQAPPSFGVFLGMAGGFIRHGGRIHFRNRTVQFCRDHPAPVSGASCLHPVLSHRRRSDGCERFADQVTGESIIFTKGEITNEVRLQCMRLGL